MSNSRVGQGPDIPLRNQTVVKLQQHPSKSERASDTEHRLDVSVFEFDEHHARSAQVIHG